MRTIAIGGLDLTSLALRECAALPVLTEGVPVQDWMADCLQQAVAERRGVILVAPHGAGKSLSITRDLARFHAAEESLRATQDAAYVPRRVVALSTLRLRDARELYVTMYRAAFDTLPTDRVYRRAKTADELRDDLICRCTEENVVAFVVDEAQTLGLPILEALRDLMAVAESMNTERWLPGDGEERATPAGIGVLLVGTMELKAQFPRMHEYGRRWIRTEEVGLVAATTAPAALTKLLPAFAEGARTMGAEAWVTLVQQVVTHGTDVPVSRLHDVARGYLRRSSAECPTATTTADLPWDEDLFRQAAYELVGISLAA